VRVRESLDDGRIEFRESRERPADALVLADIRERLRAASWLDASGVAVGVDDGRVRIEGTVAEPRISDAIQDIIARCPGVRDVDNRLQIEASSAL
jgi:osmotically-inducible protein OsmY